MAGRPRLLTPELQSQIVAFIKAGMTPVNAAGAAGVRRSTFYSMIQKGRAEDAEPLYTEFVEAIEQAEAAAIGLAESRAYQARPDLWLRYGPGRRRKGPEGWGPAVPEPEIVGDRKIVVTLVIDDGVSEHRKAPRDPQLPPGTSDEA